MTIIGNYVRADADTATSFFRDVLPKVLLMGRAGGVGNACGRVPPRLAMVLRSLVDMTRHGDQMNQFGQQQMPRVSDDDDACSIEYIRLIQACHLH